MHEKLTLELDRAFEANAIATQPSRRAALLLNLHKLRGYCGRLKAAKMRRVLDALPPGRSRQ